MGAYCRGAALEAVVREARKQEFISWLRDGAPGADFSPEMLAEVRGQWAMNLYLAGTSAWHRCFRPPVIDAWLSAIESGTLGTTAPVRMEVLYSAQNLLHYRRMQIRLDTTHQLLCTPGCHARAEEVQGLLAETGGLHHRSVKISDLLIAAVAEQHGATVWHYDADFDRIAAITGQPTEWIVPRGSIP